MSRKTTGVPARIIPESRRASQFVSRTQPDDVAVPIVAGALVPWMP